MYEGSSASWTGAGTVLLAAKSCEKASGVSEMLLLVVGSIGSICNDTWSHVPNVGLELLCGEERAEVVHCV